MDQESLTQNGIDGAEIVNGFRSFGNTGSHLPIDIVDVSPLVARPQQPATTTPFRNTMNTIDSNNGETSNLKLEKELKNLAKGIKNHGTVIGNFDEEELVLRENAQAGSKKYRKSIETLVDNFFSTVLAHTEIRLIKKLCIKGECNNGVEIDYNFYHQLKGERAAWKQVIIDQMFTIYFLRRKNKKDPTKPLDSNTFKQYVKQVFGQMEMKGVDYDMQTYFNGKSEFHSVVTAKWAEYRAVDNDFATKKNATHIDEDAVEKFQSALENKTIKPLETYLDLVKFCVYMLGRYCLFGGRKEITYALWEQVSFGTYEDGPDKGRNFCKVKYPDFDKTRTFSFANPVTRTGEKQGLCIHSRTIRKRILPLQDGQVPSRLLSKSDSSVT
jgi:hypothetical protein